MKNFEQQISERVRSFVDEITDLARSQAMEALSAALQTGGRGAIARRGRRSNGAGPRVASSRSGRRSEDQIESACEVLLAEIGKNPGQRVEQIGAAISAKTKDLALPLRKLIKDKRVRTTGQRRATRYFPGGAGRGRKATKASE